MLFFVLAVVAVPRAGADVQPIPARPPYLPSDASDAAAAWRNGSSVRWATAWLRDELSGASPTAWLNAPYQTDPLERAKKPQRQLLHPGVDDASVSMHDLAMAFEIALGPMGLRPNLGVGNGVEWYGVHSQQGVVDSAMLHRLLWQLRPDLIIELGTMCGGSAVFYARTALGYNPHARVLTFDTNANEQQRLKICSKFHTPHARGHAPKHPAVAGLLSPQWRELVDGGTILPTIGSALKPATLASLRAAAANATNVMVIDDGDQSAPSVLKTFGALSPLVSEGAYYLVQDTRLESDCAHAVLVNKGDWCRTIIKLGGPATAVANLLQDPGFQAAGWTQDREVESWGITQHPGGFLRRGAPPRRARGTKVTT